MFTDANNVTELRYVVKNDSKQYVEVIKEDEPNEEIDGVSPHTRDLSHELGGTT